MTDFEALAKRCEQATRSDRELDGDIAAALSLHPAGWRRGVKAASAEAMWFGSDGYETSYRAPDFTASLDAALTLVPEGMVFNVGNDARLWAYAWRDTPDYDGMPHSGLAGSPALALCAAVLRARGAAHE